MGLPYGTDPFIPPTPIAAPGGTNDPVLAAGGVGWASVYAGVNALAGYYARAVALDGVTAWSNQGKINIDIPYWTVDADGSRPLPFPAPAGWTRKFTREI